MRIIAISALPLWVMGEGKGLPSIYYSAKRFADAGHEIHFITPQLHLWNGDLDASFRRMPRDEIRDRIHVHRFRIPLLSPMRISGRLPIPRSRVLLYSKALFDFLTQAALVASFTTCALLRARRVIRESGAPDAVMAHNEIASLAAFLIARRRRIPSVTKLYGTFLMRIKWDRLHRIANFSAIMGFTIPCDCLIVDDDGTRGDCIAARLGVPPERFRFLMNGVDRGLYEPSIATVEAK